MSMCTKAITGACVDDQRETLNSLLRVKTPFHERDLCEEVSVRTASCACFPLKCLEAVGMIACGAILWPIPCTICKIETEHRGADVSVKKIYPGFRTPNFPCHYSDEYSSNGQVTITKGTSVPCSCCQIPEGEQNNIYATSSLTGYNCLSSGVVKIVNTLFSMACCPLGVVFCGSEPQTCEGTSQKVMWMFTGSV